MPGPGEFNPPANPTAGAEYSFGGVTWEFDAQFGVWNISDGTIIGGEGPPGPPGPPGPAGPSGAEGSVLIATSSITGVASFDPRFFAIGGTGHLKLATGHQATGDTVQAGSFITVSGTKAKTINNVGVHSINSITGPFQFVFQDGVFGSQTVDPAGGGSILVTTVLYNSDIRATPKASVAFAGINERLTGNSSFLYGGGGALGGLTFTSDKINISNSSLSMTVTGPNIIIGQSTQVTGGVFTNPAEKSVKYTLADNVNDIVINGLSGTIQRYVVNPSGTITVKCGSSWRNVAGDTETIAVMVHSLKGNTGTFDGNIISGNPVLFGVTGGLEMFTIMRVSIDGTNGLTMGLQVANGLTGKNFNF